LPAPGGPTITMHSEGDARKFEPATLTVPKGSVVTWKHSSGSGHTATTDPAKVKDPGRVAIPPGATAWDSGTLSDGRTWSPPSPCPAPTSTFACRTRTGTWSARSSFRTDRASPTARLGYGEIALFWLADGATSHADASAILTMLEARIKRSAAYRSWRRCLRRARCTHPLAGEAVELAWRLLLPYTRAGLA